MPLLGAGLAEQLLAAAGARLPAGGGRGWRAEDFEASAAAAFARLAARLERALIEEGLLLAASVRPCPADPGTLLVRGRRPGAPEQEQWRLADLGQAASLCCGLCPGAEGGSEAVEAELRSTLENECLALAFQARVWAPRFAAAASLWAAAPPGGEGRLLFWEQVAAFAGHPLHVMAKSRVPMTLEQCAAFAPEFAPEVRIVLLAVHQGLMRVFPSPSAWRELWRGGCPAAARLLEEALPGAHAEHVLLPLHPLNEPKVRELFASELAAGRMHLLAGAPGAPPLRAVPTLSMRTLVPQGSFPGLRLKLPVPVVATSLPRYVSPVEALGSVLLSRALRRLPLPEELVVQLEEHTAHLRFRGGGEEPGERSYEDARYCSAIFRQSPLAVAREGRRLVPLAALFSRRCDGGPRLWGDFWQQHGIRDGRAWFSHYAGVVVRAQLGLLLRYGLSLEAHGQNTCLEFQEDGSLGRLICQELGGGAFWDPERLAALPAVDFRREVYARDDILEPFDKCVAVVRHTMLRLHLLPLAGEAAAFFELAEADLRRAVESTVRGAPGSAWAAQWAEDTLPADAYSRYAAAAVDGLLRPSGALKALLRMRLMQTKGEIYVEESCGGPAGRDGVAPAAA